MSLTEIRNVVLMLSNPAWYEGTAVSNAAIRNITALSTELAYDEAISQNLTTLTTTNAETRSGAIHGLLYVPTIPDGNPCSEDQYDPSIGLPRTVTKRANLPPANYKLVALAPWFSKNCTKAYLQAARFDPVRAFIFYRPNNSTNKPQAVDEPIWDLDDGGAWVNENKFPIFAIPGRDGKRMAAKLAQYSGSVNQVPFGEEILDAFGPNPRDYVRIWTQLTMEDKDDIPALWTFFVIVIGALLGIIACVSLCMHLIQRRRRRSLTTRVEKREVDLEALGIARVTVPEEHVKTFTVYTYQSESEISSCPPTPSSQRGSSRHGTRSVSSVMSISGRSRSSIAGSEYSTAATNDQPRCQICLDYFVNRVSPIRQLDCGHIFHPECIDEFLIKNSSLCPVCKQCMLPPNYCPKITNAMVRRERALRRLRSTIHEEVDSVHRGKGTGRFLSRLSLRDLLPHSRSSEVPLTPIKSSRPTREAPPRTPSATRLRRTTTSSTTDGTPSPESVARQQQPDTDTVSRPEPTQQRRPTSSEVTPGAESEDTVAALPRTQRRVRRHRSRPNQLRLKPPATNGGPPGGTWAGGTKEPSDRTRARMRDLALLRGEDALPLADDEVALPTWKKVLGKVFPS